MYTEHFGLTEAPFSIAPNPQYLFMSRRHKDALAHLLYGIQSGGGFVLLTGEVGTGKTTLCRCLLEQIPEDVETAFVLNPLAGRGRALLATICDEFGISYANKASLKKLVDLLNAYLMETHSNHRKAVLIIDEAQNLSFELLEQLRLLTNLETNERKLLQIILLGQPELLEMLEDRRLRQLSQRIVARFHLEALNSSETEAYIVHRLAIAHGEPELFKRSAIKKIYRISAGIPRIINLICDRALLGTYAEHKRQVTPRIIRRAANEVLGPRGYHPKPIWIAAVVTALLLIAAGAWTQRPAGVASPGITEIETSEPALATATPSAAISTTQTPPVPLLETARLNIRGHASPSEAYPDLFALWGTSFEDKSANPCDLAAVIGLGCLEKDATLQELRKLNRPVVVQLNNEYFTLASMLDDTLTVIAGSDQFDLTPHEFESNYNGMAQMLWRMPPAYEAPIKKNDRGPAVDWLVTQLALIEGRSPPLQTGFTFDNSLEEKVRDFQKRAGLSPDGIVGSITWIHLNDVETMSIPTLSSRDQE
jgi:general secretion pathway protein A|tara:strand:- start:7 stop:1617 length:1611 start_codon:yes stop_codon:yes gene_type:complete